MVADIKRHDILECYSLVPFKTENMAFMGELQRLCSNWDQEDCRDYCVTPDMREICERMSNGNRTSYDQMEIENNPSDYIRPYISLYRMYTNYCFGSQDDVITSKESAKHFLKRVNELTAELQPSPQFMEKRVTPEGNELIKQFSIEMKKLGTTNEEEEQNTLLKLSSLQSQIIFDLVLHHSHGMRKVIENAYNPAHMICLLRDPFVKLMTYVEHMTIDDPQDVDKMYQRIFIAIQHYYVIAIHEIMLYIYLFNTTYNFSNHLVPVVNRHL